MDDGRGRLKAHRRQLTDPKIKKHRGRIVNLTGEGLLVEFPSVVDAVRCAVEIQRAMVDRDADFPTTSASPCASESMSATSSSTATTFAATASISPRALEAIGRAGGDGGSSVRRSVRGVDRPPLSRAELVVRIHLPPAASQRRTPFQGRTVASSGNITGLLPDLRAIYEGLQRDEGVGRRPTPRID